MLKYSTMNNEQISRAARLLKGKSENARTELFAREDISGQRLNRLAASCAVAWKNAYTW
jgi:hypothetical protein